MHDIIINVLQLLNTCSRCPRPCRQWHLGNMTPWLSQPADTQVWNIKRNSHTLRLKLSFSMVPNESAISIHLSRVENRKNSSSRETGSIRFFNILTIGILEGSFKNNKFYFFQMMKRIQFYYWKFRKYKRKKKIGILNNSVIHRWCQ